MANPQPSYRWPLPPFVWVELRHHHCRIFFQEFQVYGFPFTEEPEGLARASHVLFQFRNFPFQITDKRSFENSVMCRDVRYQDRDVFVDQFLPETGTLALRNAFRFSGHDGQFTAEVDLFSTEIEWMPTGARVPTEPMYFPSTS